MNRAAINSAPLGVGTKTTLVASAVRAAFELACELRTTLIKYGSFTTDLTLQGAVRPTHFCAHALTFVGELAGRVAARALRPVNAAFVTFHQLGAAVFGTREVVAPLTLVGACAPGLTPAVQYAVVADFITTFELSGQVSGEDLNYEPAPTTRRVAVAHENRSVAVPGSDNSMGV